MFVYSVSYLDKIDSLFNNGFSRQFLASNEGTDYGDGVYCNINIQDSLNRWNTVRHRGGCILKLNIVGGLDRFLIFHGRLASEVYGECSIKNQVYSLFGEDADKVWRDFSNIMKNDVYARDHFNGRTAELLQVLLSPRHKHRLLSLLPPEDRGRNIRGEYEALFKKHNIRGAIYRGMKDGLCLVAYDFGICIPFAYSVDGGKTWKEKEYRGSTVDVHKKFGLKYKNIDYPIQVNTGDGDSIEVARVLKKNGKYNYIESQSGDELSPIDFDYATSMNPENGEFEIEYNRHHYKACLYGFFVNDEEYEAWDGHSFDELRLLNESQNSYGDELVDEVKYGNFEMPTIEELDNDSYMSLYHVTNSSAVDALFKFGFDREYLNVMVYGRGVYTTSKVEDARTLLGSYGDAIVRLKVIGGYEGFLILQENIARKVYGDRCDILSQLKTMLPEEEAYKLYNQCGHNTNSYAKIAGEYNIKGIIYDWGRVVAYLVFDISCVIPYSVSLDGGKTFKKKVTDETIYRFMTSIDVDYRYGHLYSQIDKAIAGENENGEPTGYARVRKRNGKYNYIDIQTGNELSPIDFDYATSMNPENGEFEIEYHGGHYKACIYGFFVNDEEYEAWDGHSFDELRLLDENTQQQLQNLVLETIKNTINKKKWLL